jgi:zinc protease
MCLRGSVRFALAMVVCATVANAQDVAAPDASSVVRKNLAPVSDEVLEVTLPRAVEATLDNGLRVLVLEDDRSPIVTMQLTISGAGPLYESRYLAGIAAMTARMLREGTTTRSNSEILEQVARLGANLNTSSTFGSDVTSVSASGLSRNMEEWFEVMRDVLLNPTFPEAEFDRLRQEQRAGLRQQRTSSGFLANERFSDAVFGDHPAATRSATEASLDAMSTELVAQWHRERYAPQNSILSISGDVDAGDIVSNLNDWLADWEQTEYVAELPPNPEAPSAAQIFLVDRPDSAQTTLYMGSLAVDRRDPDYIPLTVMNAVLGGGPSARLFLNLREEKGYTYGAYSSFSALKYPGSWRVSANVRTEVTDGGMTEFLYELGRMRDELVAEDELEEVKRSIVAQFALSLERPTSLLSYSTTREIYGFASDYWETYPEQVMAVTPAMVQSIANKYLGPETMQIVAVGNASEIRVVLEQYGPVEVYDTEGILAEEE